MTAEGEGTGDRGGRHVQDVGDEPGPGLGVEGGSLTHAEAMLLVDDGDGEGGEGDRRLDQGVGSDGHGELPRGELGQDVGAPGGRGRPGEEREGDVLGADQALDRGEVLLGERLGRRHQHGLAPVLGGAEHRVEGDHRLAAPDLPHQEALHRAGAGELAGDRRDGALLVAGELEREPAGQPAPGQLRLVGEGRGGGLGPAAGAAMEEGELGEEELLEGEPPAPGLGPVRLVGEVDRGERRRAVGEPLAGADHRRERLDHVGQAGAGPGHEGEDLGRGEAVGGRVVGDLARPGDRLLGDRVVGDAELPRGLVLAVEDEPRPGPVPADEPGLVEERDLHRRRLVGDGRLDERAHSPPADRPAGDRADRDDDGRRLPGSQRGDRPGLPPGAGEVFDELADAPQAEGLGRVRRLALQLERGGEQRRPGPAEPGGEQLVPADRIAGREGARPGRAER